MPPSAKADSHSSDFLQLLREFLVANERLTAVVDAEQSGALSFESIRDLVGVDER
jgi:hypothetical protein